MKIDLRPVETGYHRLLRTVFGYPRPELVFNSSEELVVAIQTGALPAPLTDEAKRAISDALAGLSEREADVLKRHYGLEGETQTLKAIGEAYGLSSERVGQIRIRALAKLRHPVRNGKLAIIPVSMAELQRQTSLLLFNLQERVSLCRRQLMSDISSLENTISEEVLSKVRVLYPVAEVTAEIKAERETKEKAAASLNTPVSDLELTVRTANCLEAAQIQTVRQLVVKTEQDLLCYRNFGRKSLNELKDVLAEMGLSFGIILEEEE